MSWGQGNAILPCDQEKSYEWPITRDKPTSEKAEWLILSILIVVYNPFHCNNYGKPTLINVVTNNEEFIVYSFVSDKKNSFLCIHFPEMVFPQKNSHWKIIGLVKT